MTPPPPTTTTTTLVMTNQNNNNANASVTYSNAAKQKYNEENPCRHKLGKCKLCKFCIKCPHPPWCTKEQHVQANIYPNPKWDQKEICHKKRQAPLQIESVAAPVMITPATTRRVRWWASLQTNVATPANSTGLDEVELDDAGAEDNTEEGYDLPSLLQESLVSLESTRLPKTLPKKIATLVTDVIKHVII